MGFAQLMGWRARRRDDLADGRDYELRLIELHMMPTASGDHLLAAARKRGDRGVILLVLLFAGVSVGTSLLRQASGDHDDRSIAKWIRTPRSLCTQQGELLVLDGIEAGDDVANSTQRPCSHP